MREYKLKEYIDELNKENLIVKQNIPEEILDKNISFVTYNSKDVEQNSLFVCKGDSFKKDYLEDAIKNGACVYLSEKEYDVDFPCIIVNNIRIALMQVSNVYFDYPNDKITKIGITGTKGKTTTSFFVKYILDVC